VKWRGESELSIAHSTQDTEQGSRHTAGYQTYTRVAKENEKGKRWKMFCCMSIPYVLVNALFLWLKTKQNKEEIYLFLKYICYSV